MGSEQVFWNWFSSHSDNYAALETLSDEGYKDELLEKLLTALHNYSNGLYFEIGGQPGGMQEFIITADGNVDYFEKVEQLVANAPSIPNWKIISFKQTAEDLFVTEYEGLTLNPEQMWFMPLDSDKNPTDLGLIVYVGNFKKEQLELFLAGVYIVLDTLLGEKVNAEDINYLEVEKTPNNPAKKGLIELVDLPRYNNWRKEKKG